MNIILQSLTSCNPGCKKSRIYHFESQREIFSPIVDPNFHQLMGKIYVPAGKDIRQVWKDVGHLREVIGLLEKNFGIFRLHTQKRMAVSRSGSLNPIPIFPKPK